MAKSKSFEEVIREIRERKNWESSSEDGFNKAKCSICNRALSSIGRSHLVGICKNCVNDSLIR